MNLGRENEAQEFKESLSQLDKGLKSLVAMLNRSGTGTVYFGVKDNGDVKVTKKTSYSHNGRCAYYYYQHGNLHLIKC